MRYRAELSESKVQQAKPHIAYDVVDTNGRPLPRVMIGGINEEDATLIVTALNGPDQNKVDWSIVRDAIVDAADFDGIGGPAELQASFNSNGLMVVHKE